MAPDNQMILSFIQYYEHAFNTGRAEMGALFLAAAVMSFEGATVVGKDEVVAKLASLPIKQLRRDIGSLDVQPFAAAESALLINTTGNILVDEEVHPQRYSETFVLVPHGQGYAIANTWFRLNF
ncbi:MAG: nuclear transport factor 2 [Amphiamblys sp. WSBS2006]|nr:MAG: nuclear transport factor 2 [Amphiamblys sp. WSBS2006]